MSVDPSDPRSVADVLFKSISKPIRGASLFYALYYLTEVEGVERAAFDFQRIRDEYHDAFWWYGIYSITREVRHIWSRYFIDGFLPRQYFNHDEVVMITEPEVWLEHQLEGREAVSAFEIGAPSMSGVTMGRSTPGVAVRTLGPTAAREHARELATGENDDMVVDIVERAGRLDAVPGGTNIRAVNGLLAEAERELGILTEPEPYIEAVADIFTNTGTVGAELEARLDELPEAVPELDEPVLSEAAQRILLRASGWVSKDWNGPGWAAIPRHLLRRDGLPATAWTDQCWAIEHNNANWIDKINPADKDRRVVAEEIGSDRSLAPHVEVVSTLADDLLDAARDGDMSRVFDYAVHWDDEVEGLSLSRWRTRLGL